MSCGVMFKIVKQESHPHRMDASWCFILCSPNYQANRRKLSLRRDSSGICAPRVCRSENWFPPPTRTTFIPPPPLTLLPWKRTPLCYGPWKYPRLTQGSENENNNFATCYCICGRREYICGRGLITIRWLCWLFTQILAFSFNRITVSYICYLIVLSVMDRVSMYEIENFCC